MGLALHPQLLSGKPFIYVALVYDVYPTTGSPNNNNCAGSGSVTNQPCFYKTKILRYTYNTVTHSLGSPTIVIDGLMGSNDHNSGRLKISPVPESDGDYHLYYTIGDGVPDNSITDSEPTMHRTRIFMRERYSALTQRTMETWMTVPIVHGFPMITRSPILFPAK